MNIRTELIERLRADLGDCADPADIIDELMGVGALDERTAGRYVIANEYIRRYARGCVPGTHLAEEIADDYKVSAATVYRVLQKMKLSRA